MGWTQVASYPYGVSGHDAVVLNGIIYVVGGTNPAGSKVRDTYAYDPANPGAGWVAKGLLSKALSYEMTSVASDSVGKIVTAYSRTAYAYSPGTDAWGLTSTPPYAVGNTAAAAVGTKGYILGLNGNSTVNGYGVYLDMASGSAWARTANFPNLYGRESPACVAIDDNIYVISGGTQTSTLVYNTTNDSWSVLTAAALPYVRNGHTAAAVGRKILVYGNSISGQPGPPIVFDVDSPADGWVELDDAPYATTPANARLVAVGNVAYLIGGRPDNTNAVASTATDQVWAYAFPGNEIDLTPDQVWSETDVSVTLPWTPGDPDWTVLGATPAVMTDFAIATDGNNVYVMGGYDGSDIVDSCYRYSIADGTWTAIASLPTPVVVGSAAVLDGMVYFFAGYDTSEDTTACYRYDPDNDAAGWVPIANLPYPCESPATVTLGGYIYAFAGWTSDGEFHSCRYDPASGTWSTLTAPPAEIDEAMAVVIDGLIYVASRWANGDNLWLYDPAGDAWSTIAGLPGGTTASNGLLAVGTHLVAVDSSPFVSAFDTASPDDGWVTVSDPPGLSGLGDAGAVVSGSTLLIVGGQLDSGPLLKVVSFTLPWSVETTPTPDRIYSRTVVTVALAPISPVPLTPDITFGETAVTAGRLVHGVLLPDVVESTTAVHLAAEHDFTPDVVRAATSIAVDLTTSGTRKLFPDTASGATLARIIYVPDLSDNPPIPLGMHLAARIGTDDRTPRVRTTPAPGIIPGTTSQRALATVVVTVPTPAIADGAPSLPAYWTRAAGAATLVVGPKHIHAIENPDPVWNPATDGWATPPPVSGVGDYRWTVDSLPDPASFTGGWYWLGEASSHDGTASITAAARKWAADPSTGGPAWNSFFPFKPSVSAVNAHVPGAPAISHPKCVHVNPHYVEHMWLDFGKSMPQPFTWVIAGMIAADPSAGYEHTFLDSGRNPDTVGFPRLSATAVATERHIADGLPYRNRLAATRANVTIGTSAAHAPLQLRAAAGRGPGMYVGVFNGSRSMVGLYNPTAQTQLAGLVNTGTAYVHRYAVLGRQNGWISQKHASNLMIFEIRFWHRALTVADLHDQYQQLSTTYHFDQYRQV